MSPNEKHLEFLQNVITRMNTNSFLIKGWAVTIVSALLAICASSKNEDFVLAAIFPAVVFWFLDSYYLSQERKFRGQYNDVVAGVSANQDALKPFAMRPDLYVGGKYSFWSSFRSRTISGLYLPVILVLMALFAYFHCAPKET